MFTPEIRDAYTLLTKAGFTVLQPHREQIMLRPMEKHTSISIPQFHKVNIEVGDANHMLRTIHFAETNGLKAKLGEKLIDLLRLLVQTSGPAIPRKSWEPEDYPQQFEPGTAKVYPDGYTDPGFGWQGCGMSGGLIFHHHSREWAIHT